MVGIYNIFISHSWGYGDDYETLKGFLDDSRLYWRDYSVPKDDPIHNVRSRIALRTALAEKIRHASCVIVPAGVYCSYSDWIEEEIVLALEMEKPIIGVRLGVRSVYQVLFRTMLMLLLVGTRNRSSKLLRIIQFRGGR